MIESGSKFTDKRKRFYLRFKEAEQAYREIRLPQTDDFSPLLEDELTFEIVDTQPNWQKGL